MKRIHPRGLLVRAGALRVITTFLFVSLVLSGILVPGWDRMAKVPAEAGSVEKWLDLYGMKRVFVPGERVQFAMRSQGVSAITIEAYKFDPYSFYSSGKVLEELEEAGPSGLKLVKSLRVNLDVKSLSQNKDTQLYLVLPEPAGYLVVVRDGKLEDRLAVVVSGLGLVTKQSAGRLGVFSYDLQKNKVLPGVLVQVLEGDRMVASGYTDAQGMFWPQGKLGEDLKIVGRYGPSGASVYSYSYGQGEPYRIYLYTERPVYRPGHTVYFKGIARRYADLPGKSYDVPRDQPVKVEVRDSGGSIIWRDTLTTNELGSFAGEVPIGLEPSLGTYSITADIRGRIESAYFEVAEYRKPEYRVSVSVPERAYVAGDTIPVQVQADYYFGAPVTGANVRYAVYSEPYWDYGMSDEEAELYYPEGEDYLGGWYGQLVTQGEMVTGASGSASLKIKASRTKVTQRYAVEVYVRDAAGREEVGRSSTLVMPGLFQLTSRAEKFIWTPGDTARVWVKAVDLKERPVAGQRVTAVASHLRWEKQKYAEEMVAEGQVITGSDGSQTFDFKIPRPGYYLVTLRARDSRGNVVEAQEYLWSTEPGLFFGDAGARDLDVIADKPLYKAGENARIMINANVPNATVLLGIEGRQLFGMRPVTLSGYSAVVDLPIKPEYVPNVFITAALIDGTGYYSTERLIRISSEEKRLDVSVEPERPSYSPGDLARYLVKTRDSSGAPVPAEVSFGLVDSSIYAIRSETTPDIFRFFYGPRPNAVWTNYSFPEYYYGGAEKDGGSMPVRRNFQDTAFWAPVVMTDEQGTARIELTLPDDLTTWRTTVRAHTGGTAVGSATNDVVSRKDLMLRLVTPRFFTQGDEASITALVHNYTSGTARVAVELSARNVELAGPLRRTVTVKSGGIAQETWRIKASSVGSAVITGKAWVTAGQEGPTASGQSGAGSPGQGASAAGDALEVSIPVIPRGEKQVQVVTGKLGSAEPGSLLDQALSEGERVRIPVTVSSDAIPGATSVVLSLAPSIAGSAFGALDYLVSFPYGCVEQTLSSFLPDLAVSRALLELGLEYWREPEELSTMVSSGVQRLYKFQNDEGGWGWWEYDRTDPSLTAYALYGLLLAGRSGFVVDAAALARGLELARQEFLTPGTATGPDDRAFLGYVLALAGPPWSEAADRGISNLTGSLGKLAPKGQALVAMSLGLLGKTAQAREILSKLLQSAKSRADGALHWTDNRSGWTWNEPTVENTAYVLLAFMAVDPSNTRVPDIARWLVSARRGISWNSTKDTAVAILALTEFSKRFERSDASYGVQVYLNGELVDTFAVSPADAFKPARTITLDVSRFGDAVRAGGGGDVSDSRDSAGAPGSSGRQDVLEIRKDMGGVLNYTITLEQWRKKESLQPKAGGIKVERRYYKVIREKNRVREVLLGTARDGIAAGQVGIGDEVKVELTIAASSQLRYVIVEDPLPSGFSPIAEELDRYSWDYWFSRREDRDNKVVFFASWLPAGEKKLTYSLRAEREGSFRVLPTQAWAMYSPDTAGNSAEATLKVAGPR